MPRDIFILMFLAVETGHGWTYERLGEKLDMSASQVFKGLERADAAHLFIKESRHVVRRNLVEFLVHGVRYAFAIEPGRVTRGFPASWGAPGLSALMVEDDSSARVWPNPMGVVRGQGIEPLHASLPMVVAENADLHALCALVDIMRTGSARERKVASDEIKLRLA